MPSTANDQIQPSTTTVPGPITANDQIIGWPHISLNTVNERTLDLANVYQTLTKEEKKGPKPFKGSYFPFKCFEIVFGAPTGEIPGWWVEPGSEDDKNLNYDRNSGDDRNLDNDKNLSDDRNLVDDKNLSFQRTRFTSQKLSGPTESSEFSPNPGPQASSPHPEPHEVATVTPEVEPFK